MLRQYCVYIMANISRVLYVGVTNNLRWRVFQHKAKQIEGFTQKYNVNRLVHYEVTSDVQVALARDKQIKGWRRSKKVDLLEESNPGWHNLSGQWQHTSGRAATPDIQWLA